MKRIILVLTGFLTMNFYAQDFPEPYCDIVDPDIEVEEITVVEFAETEITNDNTLDVLIDETSTVIEVTPGETYTLKVQGNTDGSFDNAIFAFVDWNQNEVLDDEGEAYEVGVLFDSDGEDGEEVVYEISVPEDAEQGTTRMRINKMYTDEEYPAVMDPFVIDMDDFGMSNFPGYGQAIDLTLDVGVLGVEDFDEKALSVYPIPADNFLNISYKSEIKTVKIYNLLGQEVITENVNSTDFKIDLTRISSGNYIVKLLTEDTQHTFNFNKK